LLRSRVRQYFTYYLQRKSLFDEQVECAARVLADACFYIICCFMDASSRLVPAACSPFFILCACTHVPPMTNLTVCSALSL
jgi:hypothetical protein